MLSAVHDVEDKCQDLDMTDILNFYVHHLNQDGIDCFNSIDAIKGDLWTLFVKYNITVNEFVELMKSMPGKLKPIIDHCPKIDIEY